MNRDYGIQTPSGYGRLMAAILMFLGVLAWGTGKASLGPEPGAPGAPSTASSSQATYPIAWRHPGLPVP